MVGNDSEECLFVQDAEFLQHLASYLVNRVRDVRMNEALTWSHISPLFSTQTGSEARSLSTYGRPVSSCRADLKASHLIFWVPTRPRLEESVRFHGCGVLSAYLSCGFIICPSSSN